jgi:anti-anti-sigma factor
MVPAAGTDESDVVRGLAEVSVAVERSGMRAVTARGELDAFTHTAWREALFHQLARPDTRILLVDLSGVGFAGAVVVEALLEVSAAARRGGIELRLVLGWLASRLLELVGMSGQFAVYGSRSEAVAAGGGR